jgi:hypothetical protein
MKHSKFFNWNWQDLGKGLIMLVVVPSLYAIQAVIPQWNLDPMQKAALAGFVGYMLKNLVTPAPKSISIDPSKTSVIDSKTGKPILDANRQS